MAETRRKSVRKIGKSIIQRKKKKNSKKLYKKRNSKIFRLRKSKILKNPSPLSNHKILPYKEGIALILPENSYASFSGAFTIQVLFGSIDVHGFTIMIGQSQNFSLMDTEVVTFLSKRGDPDQNVDEIISGHSFIAKMDLREVCSIFSITQLSLPFHNLIDSFKIFNKTLDFKIRSEIFDIQQYLNWKALSKNIAESSYRKILVCGKKGIGKSSYIRFLSNFLTEIGKNVFVLDCDPDKSMYNPPSQICLHKLSKGDVGYVLNSNRSPIIRSVFLGDINPSFQPLRYINGIRYLYEYFRQNYEGQDDNYLLLNTFGWIKNYGQGFLTDTIDAVKPHVCIKIVSNDENLDNEIKFNNKVDSIVSCFETFNTSSHSLPPKKDQPIFFILNQLPKENFKENPIAKNDILGSSISSTLGNEFDFSVNNTNSEFYSNQKVFTTINGVNYFLVLQRHKRERIMAFLLYFKSSRALCSPNFSISNFFATLIPYQLEISKIHISYFNRKIDPDTIENSLRSICFGLGFIRNVDTEYGILYIVTPVSEVDLQNTNVIAIGNICLPDDLLTQKNDFHISYK
ncbi:hypothetical protein MXB_3230, partial [Myxobolus squamalis]